MDHVGTRPRATPSPAIGIRAGLTGSGGVRNLGQPLGRPSGGRAKERLKALPQLLLALRIMRTNESTFPFYFVRSAALYWTIFNLLIGEFFFLESALHRTRRLDNRLNPARPHLLRWNIDYTTGCLYRLLHFIGGTEVLGWDDGRFNPTGGKMPNSFLSG
ncbi:MAG: hypothetical protein LOD90_11800, partial [Symbiobacteriaceae bacterium]